jgi:hypothetical protein
MVCRRCISLEKVAVLLLVLAGCIATPNPSEVLPGKTPVSGTYSPEPPGPATLTPFAGSTPIPTAIVTLPTKDGYLLLLQLLSTNGECRLPCWWDITPGKSGSLDVQSKWTPLLGTAEYADLSGTETGHIGFRYRPDNLEILIGITYFVSSDTSLIESIWVNTKTLRKIEGGNEIVYDAESYKDALRIWMLPDVFSRYGPPAQVIISTEIINAEPNSPDLLRIWLLYPEHGAIVRYTTPADVIGGTIHACPLNSFVDIWLSPANDKQIYEKNMSDLTGVQWKDAETSSPFFKPVEEATGETLNEFYQTFKKPTEVCLETPLSIWPLH